MIDIVAILEWIEANPVYLVTLSFFAWYPLVSSGTLVAAAVFFYLRREHSESLLVEADYAPPVSIVISAFNEQDHIERTIRGALAIDYPDFEILIIDDGSDDDTLARVLPFVRDGSVRLVRKFVNE